MSPAQAPVPPDRSEILPLTAFRFFTAFMIFLFHLRIHFGFDLHSDTLNSAIGQGAIFMAAFFILSGFVLHYAYNGVDLLQPANLKNYYIRRFAKIYPSYFVAMLLGYYICFDGNYYRSLMQFPMQLLGMQSLFYNTFELLINGALWSLSVEIFFYLLFPFLNRLFVVLNRRPVILFGAVYFLSIYPSVVHALFGPTKDLYVNPVFRLPEFFAGMCAASWYLAAKDKPARWWLGPLAMLILGALLYGIAVLNSRIFLNGAPFTGNFSYYNVIALPLLAALLFLFARMTNRGLLLVSNNRISNYLGKISYGFYLTQFIAIGYVGIGKHWFDITPMSQAERFLSLFAINVGCAVLLYELVEKRARLRILRYFNQRKMVA